MAQKYKQESKKQEVSSEPRDVRQCTHPQRTRRQESARKCADARAKRTDQEQLVELDKLLGKGKGAKKERARLKENIRKSKENKKVSKNS
tara:strand:+ start:517 stop:786 length:270 start_codon:yes stop_codon:yes gene_type:complete